MLKDIRLIILILTLAFFLPAELLANENQHSNSFLYNIVTDSVEIEKPAPTSTLLLKSAKRHVQQDCSSDEQITRYQDVYFFRHPESLQMRANDERIFIAALLSQDGEFADHLFNSELHSDDPAIIYYSKLLTLQIAVKENGNIGTKLAKRLLYELNEFPYSDFVPIVDLQYLNALSYLENNRKKDAVQLLTKALMMEPGFYQAHLLRLSIQSKIIRSKQSVGKKKCNKGFAKLFSFLDDIMGLAPCALHSARLSTFLRAQLHNPDNDPAYNITGAYLATIQGNFKAYQRYHTNLQLNSEKTECASFILQNANSLKNLF